MYPKYFLLILVGIITVSCQNPGTTPDNEFDVAVADKKSTGLRVLFDHAHKNHHDITDSYKPFAELLRNDGCTVEATDELINNSTLSNADIFVIPTAMGFEDPGDKSPFTTEEINMLEEWVRDGGSALLITEHYPFGVAMELLLQKFGITVHNGYTEDSTMTDPQVADALRFEKSKGQIDQDHPITDGVNTVDTFTGSAVKGDSTWTQLLRLSDAAQNYNVDIKLDRDGDDVRVSVTYADFYRATGYAQALCREYGQGKVVVLSESALLTAQIDRNGNRFGMNVAGNDNKAFALNVVRWLGD